MHITRHLYYNYKFISRWYTSHKCGYHCPDRFPALDGAMPSACAVLTTNLDKIVLDNHDFEYVFSNQTISLQWPNISWTSYMSKCSHFNHLYAYDDVIKLKHFPRYWPFVRGIHRWPVNSPHKGQWRRVLMVSMICAWINNWVNNRESGDLRRHRAHCDDILEW